MSHCLLGSGLGLVADSPGAEGWNGLAGQAEAALRAGESMATEGVGYHTWSPSPDSPSPSIRSQRKGSSLLKGSFWLEVGNSS